MLPKQYRLPPKTELARVKKKGKLVQGRWFSLLVSENLSDGAQPRFALIISKKIDKRAVVRNRVRRLLTESVRSNLPRVKNSHDVVFLAKRTILGKSLAAIKKEMEEVFEKAGLLIVN